MRKMLLVHAAQLRHIVVSDAIDPGATHLGSSHGFVLHLGD
ncbi:hypothetical protein AFCDBAGC_3450 [Methylobacterium cerastii]|uniref:Uncharacterized protein n=1 Tax=Methylobacterium cerastii TaxID=932741 RepID=A0ABQ4QLE5_9HYPH|nr:hypothetical protein AFCDBAGC_3450 [Methylobacterium cerastii]